MDGLTAVIFDLSVLLIGLLGRQQVRAGAELVHRRVDR